MSVCMYVRPYVLAYLVMEYDPGTGLRFKLWHFGGTAGRRIFCSCSSKGNSSFDSRSCMARNGAKGALELWIYGLQWERERERERVCVCVCVWVCSVVWCVYYSIFCPSIHPPISACAFAYPRLIPPWFPARPLSLQPSPGVSGDPKAFLGGALFGE